MPRRLSIFRAEFFTNSQQYQRGTLQPIDWAAMDVDGDSNKSSAGSNGDNDILHPISHEEFYVDFRGCPTCFCLSEKGSIEARRKLQGVKVPHSWPDELKLSFHDLESTCNDYPFCFTLHAIIC
jgi:hypothetical protein